MLKRKKCICWNCNKSTPYKRLWYRGLATRTVTCPYCHAENDLSLKQLSLQFVVFFIGLIFFLVGGLFFNFKSFYFAIGILLYAITMALELYITYEHQAKS
ncbi:hypothetical protein CAI16_08525 [Virgibacillus dokdonensis]|uniref:Cxxc_20_cxxc protein n=1 Tax=Virgibacillus dokdonensis TaxID=302167 RepID=A0A3E0WQP7_9BACI|nr:hypothetical protein CAI16_08525 [Virgibacillus dokdonensis]